MLKASADSLLEIINDILDFSKIEAGRLDLDPDDFNVRETLDAALQVLALRAHQKGLELICDIDADVPVFLTGDANRLRQVVLNLVGNAIKFTDTGAVTVQAAAGADDSIEIRVIDTGPGIAVADRERIFEEFQQVDSSSTRKKGGTGLGLSISKKIIEMHGGRIWVESEPGQGSIFHFTLPLRALARRAPV
jgi:signal transduction histidine kinase